MTEAQIQLQNALTTTFLANLAFLSEYDKHLFHKVEELSKMIGNGTYKEKYALEFLMENGEFDIYDIVNDKYLYNKKPKKINDDMVKKIEFNEKNSIFDLPEYFLFKKPEKINRDKRFDYEKSSDCTLVTKNSTWEYSDALNDFLVNNKKRLKEIRKFIFLGTLLGRHIPRIAQKVDANMYLVLERNLEIFRLSLFTVDYTILANKGVIFSIMDNNLVEEKKISDFISTEGLDNYLIKVSPTGINIDKYIDKLLSVLHTVRPTAYDYARMLYIHTNRTTKVLNNSYKIVILNKIKENCKFFNNVPILYIAAGPSLDENMDWIKKNQDKFFIVTIGAAYKKLIANDIKIDIIATLDESDILEKLQFDDESVSKISKNTIILASVMTNEKILKKFNPDNLFLFEIFTSFHLKNIVFDGFSIGEVVLAILINLNPANIYLIGLDLALNQTTGATHSQASNSLVQVLNLEQEQTRETFIVDESLIKVKGNLEKEVFTTPFFYSSIKSAEAKIANKNTSTIIYNLSTHGAYFDGTIPQKVQDISIDNDITYNKSDFLKYLKKNSLTELKQDSKKEFIKEISFLNNDIKNILNDIKEKDFETYEEFYQKIIILPIKLYNNKLTIFYQIIVNYFQLMVPYLSYHFNDIKIKQEKKKLKKIKGIFVRQIEEILEDYILCLKRII